MTDLRSPHIGTKQIVEVSAVTAIWAAMVVSGKGVWIVILLFRYLHQPQTFVCPLILCIVVLLFDIMKGCGEG